MHIKSVHISNIRSIKDFKMNFDNPAGWHVIIGENGSGKSSIVKAIAFNLIGEENVGLRINPVDWIHHSSIKGGIEIVITKSDREDKGFDMWNPETEIPYVITSLLDKKSAFTKIRQIHGFQSSNSIIEDFPYGSENSFAYAGENKGWFSASFGPFRRFTGGRSTYEYKSHPRLASHLSIFGEDIALSEAIDWLIQLNYKKLENKEEGNYLHLVKKLVNSDGFLPHSAKLESISSDGVIFKDGFGNLLPIHQLSDGYRSILSLTFELIRQMVTFCGSSEVFKNIRNNNFTIPVSGVVLIDEIDAHLHPTWQTSIGQWFTKYFPNIQFIVTTHSPLICRAAEKGTIWRLAAPGSDQQSGEVTGVEKDRLVFGNILDAYGTELFGSSPARSEKSESMLKRLGELNMIAALGKINDDQEKERLSLQRILSTDDPTGF